MVTIPSVPSLVLDKLIQDRNAFVNTQIHKCDPRMREIVQNLRVPRVDQIITVACCQGHSQKQMEKKHGEEYKNLISYPYVLCVTTNDGYRLLLNILEDVISKYPYQLKVATQLDVNLYYADISGEKRFDCGYYGTRISFQYNDPRKYKQWCEYLTDSVNKILGVY